MKRLRVAGPALMVLMLLAVTGCRHRPAVVIPVASQAPVVLAPAPEPKQPPQVASIPPQPVPVPTVVLPKVKAHHQHHKTAPAAPVAAPVEAPPAAAAPPPPVQVAGASPPPPIASVIGSLTTGGDAGPERRQHAADLIESNEKRVKALPKETVEHERDAVTRVGNFDRDALVALREGDSDGALTMATKAQVLLNDVEKP